MKVEEGKPHDPIEAFGRTLVSGASITGKPVPLYPKLTEKMILNAMIKVIEGMKPYDMEDEDWRNHLLEKGYLKILYVFFKYS